MNHGLLDINDCQLQLWHGSAHIKSPGYALLEGNRYQFGSTAVSAARLRPRDVNTRYWWQLSTETLQPKLGPARHTGDLVHAHLNALFDEAGQPGEMLLAVPGSMQREQLSLLLGIINECPFNAVGLVHRSALLASRHKAGERLYHLELQLHQALLSEVVTQEQEVSVERSLPLPGVGLLALQEALVTVAADAFVRQTRFDPRRQAATEQALYNALPGVLEQLATASETNIEVGGYLARISNRDIEHIADALCQRVAEQVGREQVIADAHIGLLPGITRDLPELTLLAAEEVRTAAEAHGDHLVERGEQLAFITRLPQLDGPPGTSAVKPPAPSGPAITHLLEAGVARALNGAGEELAAGWTLARSESGWQLAGGAGEVRVNEAGYQRGAILSLGDTIYIPGAVPVTLIAVRD